VARRVIKVLEPQEHKELKVTKAYKDRVDRVEQAVMLDHKVTKDQAEFKERLVLDYKDHKAIKDHKGQVDHKA
jgi:hypothetical protein